MSYACSSLAASSRSKANSRWTARGIGCCSAMTALWRKESRYSLPDDLACRDAARTRSSAQSVRKALRHLERNRNRALGRRGNRCSRSRQFEVPIGLPSRQAIGARQRHGRLRHADLVCEQAPRRSQSLGFLRSRRTNHMTWTYYPLRRKSSANPPRQFTIIRSKRKLSFASEEPAARPAACLPPSG
jgi:hypothetical protein